MSYQPPVHGIGHSGDSVSGEILERKIPLESTRYLRNRKKAELFLAGQIPFEWIRALPSPVCRLALVVRAFMHMRHTDHLAITTEVCREAGLTGQHQRQRAVAALAKSGLFEVEQHRGRKPVVRALTHHPATYYETPEEGLAS